MTRFPAAASAAFAFFAAAAVAAADPGPGQRIFTTSGYAAFSFEQPDVLEVNHGDQRFALPPASEAERESYRQVVEEASARGFAVRVRYDGTAGEPVPGEAAIVYPLCSLSVGNVPPIGNEAANCPELPRRRDAGSRLGLAIAYSIEQPQAARGMLAGLLAGNGLDPPLRALALRIRGDSAEALAFELEPTSLEHDRLMVEALADYRNWVVTAPGVGDAKIAVARALAELGAYDEAAAVLQALGRTDPDRAFDVAIRLGALHRQRGDHRRALAELDDYAARYGRQDGMRFRYHRAWTLMMLRRDAEAAAEIGEGLLSQPDYPSAYRLRACVRARQGQIAEALADQERAYELLMQMPGMDSAIAAGEVARYRAALDRLRAASATRPRDPILDACDGLLDRWSRPRARSPLLSAAAG